MREIATNEALNYHHECNEKLLRQVAEDFSDRQGVTTVFIPRPEDPADEDYVRIYVKNALQALGDEGGQIPSLMALHEKAEQGIKGLSKALALFATREKNYLIGCDDLPFAWAAENSEPLVAPLVPYLRPAYEFWILEVHTDEAALYTVESGTIRELDVENFPNHVTDVLNDESLQKHLQHHSASEGSRNDAIFHGQGGKPDDAVTKRKSSKYFAVLSRVVEEEMQRRGFKGELLIAGTQDTVAQFEAASHLHADSLSSIQLEGAVKEVGYSQLVEAIQERVAEKQSKARERNQAEWQKATGAHLTEKELDAVEHAFAIGNARTLYVNDAFDAWLQSGVGRSQADFSRLHRMNNIILSALRHSVEIAPIHTDGIFSDEQMLGVRRYYDAEQQAIGQG